MKTKSKKLPEIMSPVGDFICLTAALEAGADAVYFGLKGSNMRAGAKNFSVPEMRKLVKLCHVRGVKAYLTLNNIYYEDESKKISSILKSAKSASVDAIIAWDMSVIESAKKIGLPIYLSTQASVSNSAAIVSYAKTHGIRRFVLARECSIGDVAKIKKSAAKVLGKKVGGELEIEVFAHGAMCVSLSGRCFLSQFSCGKSANRGGCAQPCRREYTITDTLDKGISFNVGNGYVLSPKDLCTISIIEKLFETGVDSLKIEGRNRNAEYVYATTSAYKVLRDFYFNNLSKKNFKKDFEDLKKSLLGGLEKVFNRGFSTGFFMGKPIGNWTSDGNKATSKKAILGHVTKFYPKISVAEISVDANSVKLGDTIQVESDKTGFLSFKVESMQMKGNPISSAVKGMVIAIKTPKKLREHDRVYIFR